MLAAGNPSYLKQHHRGRQGVGLVIVPIVSQTPAEAPREHRLHYIYTPTFFLNHGKQGGYVPGVYQSPTEAPLLTCLDVLLQSRPSAGITAIEAPGSQKSSTQCTSRPVGLLASDLQWCAHLLHTCSGSLVKMLHGVLW